MFLCRMVFLYVLTYMHVCGQYYEGLMVTVLARVYEYEAISVCFILMQKMSTGFCMHSFQCLYTKDVYSMCIINTSFLCNRKKVEN